MQIASFFGAVVIGYSFSGSFQLNLILSPCTENGPEVPLLQLGLVRSPTLNQFIRKYNAFNFWKNLDWSTGYCSVRLAFVSFWNS